MNDMGSQETDFKRFGGSLKNHRGKLLHNCYLSRSF